MPKGPTWFKLHVANAHMLNAMSNETVGAGLKLALQYFQTGELPPDNVNPLVSIVFETLRASADEAIIDYKARVQDGKDGARKKKEKQAQNKPP